MNYTIETTPPQQKARHSYILFGWEAKEARPNLDPYTSTLRIDDETQQVFTSDVHIKHHIRRGLRAEAAEKIYPDNPRKAEASVFYEKKGAEGEALDFGKRLQYIRNAFGVDASKQSERDAFRRCLDLPLFGYVHAVKGENFNALGAANTLFRPCTFHPAKILQLGRNNAFPGEEKEAAGSAVIDSLEYGFFLALFEVNHRVLESNASEHIEVKWDDDGIATWLSLLCSGLWRAYTTDRYSSFTQRSQFAKFLTCWSPAGPDLSFEQPKGLISKLDDGEISSTRAAASQLQKLVPTFLQGYGWSKECELARKTAVSGEFDSIFE
jgi:hypothetical protein